MFRKKHSRSRYSDGNKKHSYDRLEQRNLLAVTSFFDDGSLIVSLSEPMDVAIVDSDDGIVSVNGEIVDADGAGFSPLGVEQVSTIILAGNDGLTDTRVILNGSFDTGDLQEISFSGINQVEINGSYRVADIQGELVGASGSFSGLGELQVSNLLTLNPQPNSAGSFDVLLSNTSNDFATVAIQTTGNVELFDIDDIELGGLAAANLSVQAEGSITQAADATIVITDHTNLTAEEIDLGNNGQPVDLETLTANTAGHFALNEATSVVWQFGSQLGSANVRAGQLVETDFSSSLNIEGDARFVANRLSLGGRFSDEFNAGRLSFESEQFALIAEESSIRLFGENRLGTGGQISANGDLTATSDTVLDSTTFADSLTSFTSLSASGDIILGNELEGSIQIGQLEFRGEFVRLTLQGDVTIRGLSSASQLRLRSIFNEAGSGGILDDRATINIAGNATFIVSDGGDSELNRVVIGDGNLDSFVSQSVSFAVDGGSFELTETNRTVIFSESPFVNFAENIVINSAGDIINDPNARINVRGNAQLSGSNIVFGQPGNNDSIRLRSVTANTPGNLILDVVGAVELSGDSQIGGDAIIAPTSNLVGAAGSSFIVGGQASVFGPSIQFTRGTFASETLRFFTSGPVNISAVGDIVFAGNASHRAGNLRLTSTGSISNLPGASLDVDGPTEPRSIRLRAQGDITLGANPNDRITFDNLNFQTPGVVTINAIFDQPQNQGRIFIFGRDENRTSASEFRLTTNVDVVDGTNTISEITDFLEISALNIILGDTDSDCLSIPADAIFNTSQDAPDVTTDPTCPV